MDISKFKGVSGLTFSNLSKSQFEGLFSGDDEGFCFTSYAILKETDRVTVSSTLTDRLKGVPSQGEASQVDGGKKQKPKVVLGKYQQANVLINVSEGSTANRTGNNGVAVQLWRFILDLLIDAQHR